MLGNSFNLVDLVKAYFTDSVIAKASSILGENREKTQLGLDAGVPGLLSGLDTAASNPDGARRIATAIENSDDSALGDVDRMFGAPTDSVLGSLRSIMGGGGLSELSGNIGKFSGLSAMSVSSLLGFLAPLVFGVIRKTMRSRGLAFSDIASVLANQRSNIASAMPKGPATAYAGERLREVTGETFSGSRTPPRTKVVDTYAGSRTRHERNWIVWLLPLALLVGALALVSRLASRNTVQAGREEPTRQSRTYSDQSRFGATTLPALKSKYASVFREAQARGIQFSSIYERDGKLFLKGTAPSQEAANKVWDEIKRVNPSLNDIVADIPVTSAMVPFTNMPKFTSKDMEKPATTAEREKPAVNEKGKMATGSQMYTVKRGDTLASISKRFYGNGKDYTRILEANRGHIANKNLIEVGQRLTIP